MEDPEFNASARDRIYDPAIAHACFGTLGEACSVAEGEPFFAENEKSDCMYLLLDGEVRLFRGVRVLDIVRSGEIFGEMAVITGQPRTAWAVAREPCKALTLDPLQFLEAILYDSRIRTDADAHHVQPIAFDVRVSEKDRPPQERRQNP